MNPKIVDQPQFEPEIEELLRDVARDPDSCLLRVPRRAAAAVAMDRRFLVAANATDLSSAERHLVAVHGAELAHLLTEWCRSSLLNGSRSSQYVCRTVRPKHEQRVMAVEEWRGAAQSELELASEAESLTEGFDLLRRAIWSPVSRNVRVSQAAAAALRICPRDDTRICLAIDLILNGEPRSGESVLHDVIRHSVEPRMISCAWENVGLARSIALDAPGALAAYENALCLMADRTNSLLASLLVSVSMGNRQHALKRAHELDQYLETDDQALVWFVDCHIAWRRAGSWHPTELARNTIRSMRDSLGPVSRRLEHALA